MSAFLEERVLSVHHWTDRLFSFTTTRDTSLRFSNGHFTMIGLKVDGKNLLRAYSIASPNYEEHLEFLSIKVEDGPLTSRLQHIHVGDTIIGTKGRVAFEAPAPLIIVKAHHLLEKHVLTKQQLYWKDQLSNWYGQLMHEAQYLEPVMRNIETFLNDTQQFVTGEVQVELRPYHFAILGCTSEYDLMSSRFGEYGESNKSFSGQDVVGFTRVTANPLKIYYTIHDHDQS